MIDSLDQHPWGNAAIAQGSNQWIDQWINPHSVAVGAFVTVSQVRTITGQTMTGQANAGLLRWLNLGLCLSLAGALASCTSSSVPTGPVELDSRYNDEQPALSGNGRFLAFASNRDGSRGILMYDRQQKQFVNLPRLNRRDAIAESPSLSYTGRYIVYVASDRARPEIELYDRATQQIQILTTGYRGWIRNPSISPDGRYIAFETGIRGQWDVEVLDRGSNIELDIPDFARSRPSP